MFHMLKPARNTNRPARVRLMRIRTEDPRNPYGGVESIWLPRWITGLLPIYSSLITFNPESTTPKCVGTRAGACAGNINLGEAAMHPDQGQQMTVFGAAQLSCP